MEILAAQSLSNALIDSLSGHKTRPLHHAVQPLPLGLKVLTARTYPSAHARYSCFPGLEHDVVGIQLKNATFIEGVLGSKFRGVSHPGSCFILPRGECTEWAYKGGFDAMLIQVAPTLLAETVLHTFDQDPAHVCLRPRSLQADPLLYGIGQAMLVELSRGGDMSSQVYLETLKQTFLVHLLRSYGNLKPFPSKSAGCLSDHLVHQIVEYVESNLSRNLTLAELASMAHLSQYHFARTFKRTTGQSVHQYIISRRLAVGRHLLETSSLSIAQVAEQVGFADHSHFSRAFKRYYQISPSSLTRVRKNVHILSTNLPAGPS